MRVKILIRRFWWLPLLLVVVSATAFLGWALWIPAPMPEALAALASDDEISVEQSAWLVFRRAGSEPQNGLILYPGGRVDARAYAPAARAIAARGFLVVVTPMPLNLAVFAPDTALAVMAAYPAVRAWAVGGHSLGGAMAAAFAYRNPRAVQALVLWAAYPPGDNDLSRSALQAVSISGTRDGLATPAKIEASRALLPPGTRFVAIEGGNHAQFGWYGAQDGDNPATIGREAQQAQVVEETTAVLSALVPAPSARCAPHQSERTGYLVKICDYVVRNRINIEPGTPERLGIKEIGTGEYRGKPVVVVYLTCCYLGDRAFIDKETGEVVGYSVGAK